MDLFEVNVEVSARHVHLSQKDIDKLFGEGYELTVKKVITGGFVSEERVTVVGPKRKLERVAVLGPARKQTQIELSATDARSIGVDAPLRMSGNLEGTPGVKIIAANGNEVDTEGGAIIAKRHLHINEDLAAQYDIKQNDVVKLRIDSDKERSLVFDDVVCRVVSDPDSVVHIDTDEGNAAFVGKPCVGTIIRD